MPKKEERKFLKWKVPKKFSGKTLLVFLSDKLPDFSKRALKKAIEKNLCLLNQKIERFASIKVYDQDEVLLDSKWLSRIEEKKEDFSVLYEDEEIFVVNKGANLVCDQKYFSSKKLFLCHRLDKQTTGVLILAKTKKVYEEIIDLFKKRAVEKVYLAIVDGALYKKSGIIENRIGKAHSYQGQSIHASGRGREAVTIWSCLDKAKLLSFVKLQPKTGRTHQLRVHLSEMGHPILGDAHYAKSFAYKGFVPRVLLHNAFLSFMYKGKKMVFTAPLPSDFKEVAKKEGLCLKYSL